jgi:hypothetical protein
MMVMARVMLWRMFMNDLDNSSITLYFKSEDEAEGVK